MSNFKVKLNGEVELTDQQVEDLLCCALEGGSNYWYVIKKYDAPQDKLDKMKYKHLEVPFENGCALIIDAAETDDSDLLGKRLDRETMQKGLQIMHDKYIRHFDNVVDDDADAETGDVFLQCALFGELVFG